MREFGLETYFTKSQLRTRYHLTASDAENPTLPELPEMAEPRDLEAYQALRLGYTDSLGAPDL